MRRCKYCDKSYQEEEFGVALTIKEKTYRRLKCKYCYRQTKKKLSSKYRLWIQNYKKKQKCTNCGFGDYRALEFHHMHRKKDFSLGNAFNRGIGIVKIKEEIKKCSIICANCHRILHYKE